LLLCSSYLPLGVPNGLLLTSHHQPVQSIITAPGVVLMSSASPPQRTSVARLPCAFLGGDMEILAGSARHAPGCLVLQDRSRAFSGMPLSPSWGRNLLLQASLPARGRGLHLILPSKGGRSHLTPGNALPRAELAGGFAAGIVPGLLPGNGSGRRDAAMAELPKMPVEEFSRHL
jgi:hypothetical protein